MIQSKKIFTRMCLNNWGGISHKILEFNEYVNLFSGMSGSGKSTVMDAIQVILYGSLSSNFLNKAADDAKNKRSVLSYLRGEQKDGTANRDNQDFCSVIVLEILDMSNQITTCVGIVCEVRKNDTEIKKYSYFSHSGKMPEDGYITEEGFVYDTKAIKSLVNQRETSRDNRGKGEVNKVYGSRESYIKNLYGPILGYIEGTRFSTMEKSAIALKMTNGTGQFIRDYMFTKSEGQVIGRISEQLGAYRDIKEKIDDIKKRIDLLTVISEHNKELTNNKIELELERSKIKCLDIMDAKDKISAWESDLSSVNDELEKADSQKEDIKTRSEALEKEYIDIQVQLKSSDLGSKRQHLKDLINQGKMLAQNSGQWRNITAGLKKWEEEGIASDYISNTVINDIREFSTGKVTKKSCIELSKKIKEEKKEIDNERSIYDEQRRNIGKDLLEKKKLVDDISNNRKPYSDNIKKVKQYLETKLSAQYKKKVTVNVFADLFDITDDEWKDAIEGRMGSLKLSLITEPEYAHNAAVAFRSLNSYEDVKLINSAAISSKENKVFDNSLYEAVSAKEDYVNECLKNYIGRIVKCRSVEELENVRDGVTPDCYSYSNFMFRHLRRKDYTTGACIGSKVSKAKLAQYEEDVKKLESEHESLTRTVEALKAVASYEDLNYEPDFIVQLADSGEMLEKIDEERTKCEKEIAILESGKYQELKIKEEELSNAREKIKKEAAQCDDFILQRVQSAGSIKTKIKDKTESLDVLLMGYVKRENIENALEEELKKLSAVTIKGHINSRINSLDEMTQKQTEQLMDARNHYIHEYPGCGFNGAEQTNQVYDEKLMEYQKNYEPEYQEQFDKQCKLVYNTLRDNIIAKIHGEIKAATRHKTEINRLLRKTNFSDSTYQIKIEAAKDENGQFYEMLMAPELDNKVMYDDDVEGQISFGDDEFYQKYEDKIRLLTDKFMPAAKDDDRTIEQRHKEMEKYADYRTYLSFSMYEQVTDSEGNVIRENYVDDMAGRDSGGEGQNPKYVALLAGFAMLYMEQSNRDSKIKLVLLDEAFSKMDQKRSEVCLKYARKLNLQLIVCVPDERLASLIRNVDCVYGFRRNNNQVSMMHIDKGSYLNMMEGE